MKILKILKNQLRLVEAPREAIASSRAHAQKPLGVHRTSTWRRLRRCVDQWTVQATSRHLSRITLCEFYTRTRVDLCFWSSTCPEGHSTRLTWSRDFVDLALEINRRVNATRISTSTSSLVKPLLQHYLLRRLIAHHQQVLRKKLSKL